MNWLRWGLLHAVCLLVGCADDIPQTPQTSTATGTDSGTTAAADEESGDTPTDVPDELDVFGFANGCYAVRADDQWLQRTQNDEAFEFTTGDQDDSARFFMKASALGTYLFYDTDGSYFVSDNGPLLRRATLRSDVLEIDDSFVSGAEWELETSIRNPETYQLRHRKTERYLGTQGLVDTAEDAATVTFESTSGCAEHPELTLDASGEITTTEFDDGTLFGIVDTHSHILSNFGFGGGGIFHGSAFHRLGVEHALSDCSIYHGEMGRKDLIGFVFDGEGTDSLNLGDILPILLAGELDEDIHETAGYPEFTDWPNAPKSSTHQTQYYRWLERAWMGGLRLVVQHATSNSAICHLTAGEGIQETRYSCNDMVAVDRIIDETYNMEQYIDAQNGGPGQGWFRIVQTPAQAREVIREGKMAVVLGIETSDLFDCTLVPRPGFPTCDEAYVVEQLNAYYDRGIRVIFPVHKYDNAFSAGDGDRAFIELGNFTNSGHWSNFTDDCPAEDPSVFDHGSVFFGGLNMPRDEYFGPAPNDMSDFGDRPVATLVPFLSNLEEPPLEGDHCQKTGLTELGETLMLEMMQRGMIIEIDHLPRRSYLRAFELLQENNYPAAATHGSNYGGRIYDIGGISKANFSRCRKADNPNDMLDRLTGRIELIDAAGGYPAEGFGFDLNGFAGAPRPRFGEDARCDEPQDDPITYPFESYGGDVTFTQPRAGNREMDFNTEGLAHIGLLPELIEDARENAESDERLEPLFRSAEGYIRMWERSETRASALRSARR